MCYLYCVATGVYTNNLLTQKIVLFF